MLQTILLSLLGAATVGALLAQLMKKYVTMERIAYVARFCYTGGKWLGVTITLGLSRWKVTKKFWNKTFEPYFVLLFKSCLLEFGKGVEDGLESDNTNFADEG